MSESPDVGVSGRLTEHRSRLVAYVGSYGSAPGGGGIDVFDVSMDDGRLTALSRADEPKEAGYLAGRTRALRGVLGIGLASLLADAGRGIPRAILPGFLTATLGAPAAALGLIEGLADGAAGGARLGLRARH